MPGRQALRRRSGAADAATRRFNVSMEVLRAAGAALGAVGRNAMAADIASE
jgi:hypothetical protein